VVISPRSVINQLERYDVQRQLELPISDN